MNKKPTEISATDLARKLVKLPPRAIEAEMALLGSMFLNADVITDVTRILRGSEDFFKPAHAAIYLAITDLWDNGKPLEVVGLRQWLDDHQQLELVGGLNYLLELVESVPNSASAPHYADEVLKKAQTRDLIRVTSQILYECYEAPDDVQALIDHSESEMFKIAKHRADRKKQDFGQLLQETYDKLEAQEDRHYTGLETGFIDLDNLTRGLQNGEVIIIAGRPSMGKTALALNILEHVAIDYKMPGAMFSLEMSKDQLATRMLCSRSGVDSHRLQRNMLSSDDFNNLALSIGEMSDAPIFIDDTGGLTLSQLRGETRRLVSRHGIKLLIVDYLQLMTGPKSNSRQEEVSAISRGMKALAREINIPIVCLAQLNRQVENRADFRPRMSDLRESGSLEQDADVIILLHREEYYHDKEWVLEHPDKQGLAEAIIAKQRNGPTDTIRLHWDARTTRFSPRDYGRLV